MTRLTVISAFVCLGINAFSAQPETNWRDLFNGKDLRGWVNVNTAPDTWRVKGGVLICSGKPQGVLRSEKEYENFVLHVEWMHTEPGGNSGVFAWTSAKPVANGFPSGIEIGRAHV